MSNQRAPDDAARREALDTARSFIVQAPAGAGKTELLTQRYLALLGSVDRPEEILAITFTKKAAAEMRARVLDALTRARETAMPEKEHERRTWELARRARERDAQRGWRIEDSPSRLRIQTIDSFCLGLAQQMPLRARLGAPLSVEEDPTELYREAAFSTFALMEDAGPHGNSVRRLLRYLDGDLLRTAELLIDMLARRDQWLRRVGDRTRLSREALEAALLNVVLDALADVKQALPSQHAAELIHNLCLAAANLRAAGTASPISACVDLSAPPGAVFEHLPMWQGMAELLLTADGEWRKAINKRIGFRAPSEGVGAEKKLLEEAKRRFAALLDELRSQDRFREALHHIRLLPPIWYDDVQWEMLQVLVDVLPLTAAQLKLVFAARGCVDFSEIMQAALNALGEPEAPTDLLLTLDYRLRHVLVDEFQDTSLSQFELLERLTAGWAPGDGRSLFLVGDPMQSIYRFREADVGLYLRAAHGGIGAVALERLALSSNFRSQAGIVDWVNETFSTIFPPLEDIGAGAVPYSPCSAIHGSAEGTAVRVHPFFGAGARAEARKVAELVRAAQAERPDGTIAILVRNKGHVSAIAAQLHEHGLRFLAVEIDRLTERQVVQDLLALTRALLHLADRPAWLAILRAPWCGLALADFDVLIGADAGTPVWDLLHDPARLAALSADGRARLQRITATLSAVFAQRARLSLRRFIEGAWIALGGPAGVNDETELADAEVYFELLDEFGAGGDLAAVEEQAQRLFAVPDTTADERLQIMTIHKSKGLEFDTVIVPSLGRRTRSDPSLLLQWTERARGAGTDLLLAPIHATGSERDAISEYLRGLEQTRARNEALRLLYVATTRARTRLHLLGQVQLEEEGRPELADPESSSLLATLWPVVRPVFLAVPEAERVAGADEAAALSWEAVQDNHRIAADWQAPAPAATVGETLGASLTSGEIEFDWAGTTARHVGTVVHRWLLRIGADGLEKWNVQRVAALAPVFTLALARLGVSANDRPAAVERVSKALTQTLDDPRAAWLFGAHSEARAEYALTGVVEGRVVNVVLDRTFVDEQGVRWIIDYKTSVHEGADIEAFLDQEQQRYRAQLDRYAHLFRERDARPIRLGLYFPLLRGWRERAFGA